MDGGERLHWWWFLDKCFGRSQVIGQQDPGHVSMLGASQDQLLPRDSGRSPGRHWPEASGEVRVWVQVRLVVGAQRQYVISSVSL